MLSSLSCRANWQNDAVLLGWIYLGNLFWVRHHLYHHFALEQLTILSHHQPIYTDGIYLLRILANFAINKSVLQRTSLEPVKLLCNKEGLHFGMTLFNILFFLHCSHFCHHMQFSKPTVILQLNLWKLDQNHSII